ncbi:unnamed protein product [Kluyveromyces dobzhanskii CBS 2104]|uniref:WGS project CCBQ000000000 data, contig 00102 n=1 Tax=Kluyveromyces dobzhanskii CBS 2104 TaxID=1427455 RepID=A0A0A8L401_9SACH|nr:unnamed protein product [Kluyveromyces dobzhanskii CBS 2104]
MTTETVRKEKTLHELFSNSFNRSPDGSILTYELKTVFSMLIICLSLEEKPKSTSNRLLSLGKKSFPFTFSITEAVALLQDLELNVEMNLTSIYISYSIKPELGHQLLDTFMKAKLVHTPADKTRSRPKENILLQPTAKGVAIACDYARKIALKELPLILTSNFNTMKLFKFERNTTDDSVIQSEYFINLLFNKVMGPKPNIWSPRNPPDKVPKLSELLEQRSSDLFSFENVSPDYVLKEVGATFENSSSGHSGALPHAKEEMCALSTEQLENDKRESPFAHRFFSNPDSDSHIQYYVSDCGLRLFYKKTFGKDMTIDYCFSTKALWQWLMECTDIMFPKEAVSVAALFLKYGLITPILLPPSKNSKRKFIISKTAYYTFSQAGWDVIKWGPNGLPKDLYIAHGSQPNSTANSCIRNKSDTKFCRSSNPSNLQLTSENSLGTKRTATSNSDISSESGSELSSESPSENCSTEGVKLLSLKQILTDPGMRYLFRSHLCKEMCAENLDVYFEIAKFLKRMSVLRKLIESRKQTEENKLHLWEWKANGGTKLKNTIQSALLKHTNECLSLVYHIYSSYIASGAPHQLNIDHNVRETITRIILHPKSPTNTMFNLSDKQPRSQHSSNKSDTASPLKTCDPNFVPPPDTAPVPLVPERITKDTETYIIEHAISMLKDLYLLMEQIRRNVYLMMKNDSMPKFLEADSYRDAILLITAVK